MWWLWWNTEAHTAHPMRAAVHTPRRLPGRIAMRLAVASISEIVRWHR